MFMFCVVCHFQLQVWIEPVHVTYIQCGWPIDDLMDDARHRTYFIILGKSKVIQLQLRVLMDQASLSPIMQA